MSATQQRRQQQPHALVLPFPSPGHINPMMQLAKRLSDQRFFITFVNTQHIHDTMFKGKISSTTAASHPNVRFEHIPDGLPSQHKRFNEQPAGVVETAMATLQLAGPLAKLVQRIMSSNDDDQIPPLTCIIADAFCSWAQDVADLFHIPRVSLWTTPVHANLAYTFQPTLHSLGLIPVTDESKLQTLVDCIDGISTMKLENYVSFFLADSPNDFLFQMFLRFSMKRPREAIWNLGNNFEELEHEACTAFKREVPNFLTMGPLLPIEFLQRDTAHADVASDDIISCIWPRDIDAQACHNWLSQHEKASVIYISFGSIVHLSESEIRDLIQGLEESGAPFLWAVRPDQGGAALSQLRERLDSEAAQGKPSSQARITAWAPQLAVLTHPSVGLFISHCGWNSIIESISGGVPILAKPGGFAEQQMNAHYVADVWKIGHRLPSGAKASEVKSLISLLMGSSPEAASVQGRLCGLRETAMAAISAGGSSSSNFQLFVEDMYRRAGAAAPDTSCV